MPEWVWGHRWTPVPQAALGLHSTSVLGLLSSAPFTLLPLHFFSSVDADVQIGSSPALGSALLPAGQHSWAHPGPYVCLQPSLASWPTC